jgi:hypothetical protein
MEISIDNLNFLLFVIPGFITVWSFRYFTRSKKTGDFEFLGLSFFWGLSTLLLTIFYYKLFLSQEKFLKMLENPYAAAFILSLFGFIFGWVGGVLSRIKWFHKIINWLKNFPS